jgi:site-specific DNA-methyltransferase (adenine-specific)
MNYDVILADPPWKFRYYNEETTDEKGAAQKHYDLMELEEICALPIGELGADNSLLFLWVTWPMLPKAFEVMKAWNYTYRTLGFVWVKANPTGFGFFTGLGYYTRSNSEPCLIGGRGFLPRQTATVSQLIYAPIREHSRKPEDTYRKIERLYPDHRYLELFARRKREGWDSWGNEIESDLEIGV